MSRFTDENGEQVYPNNVVIDHKSAEDHDKEQIEWLKHNDPPGFARLEINEAIEAMNTFGATLEQSKRFISVMSTNKLSKALVGSEYAWALYIKTGANKECSFEEYLRYNKSVPSWEWEMLNRTYSK